MSTTQLRIKVDASARPVVFELDGKTYTLEFTVSTAQALETAGFSASDYKDKPISMTRKLIYGMFAAHHKTLKYETIDAIWARIRNRGEVLSAGVLMYSDVFKAFGGDDDEPDENEAGNAVETPET